jgi:LacI family transcriptional regulator
MPVTLKDIAAQVGVSVNTASRALKDKKDIGLKTRERVKEAAAALGYRPNLNARSLVLKKTSTVGVAVTEPSNPVRVEFCERLRECAAADGYRLLTASLTGSSETRRDTLDDLLARRVDGLIAGYIRSPNAEQPFAGILRECHRAGLPAVVFGDPETTTADCLEIDFFDSARRLTEHAISRGYRDIALFCPPGKSARLDGYRHAMTAAGLAGHIRTYPLNGSGFAGAAASLEAFLKEFKRPPRAIIGYNDISAIGIISALKKHGWRVPEDCAAAGVDNIAYGEYHDPPLTSIGFDAGVFAETVWQLLKARLNGTETGPPRRLKLHQQLVIRQSC